MKQLLISFEKALPRNKNFATLKSKTSKQRLFETKKWPHFEFKTMFLIGLTGGAATGKSTASSYFRNLGVPVIDADEVARKIVEPGEPAFLEIKATFGQDVIDPKTGAIVS